MKVEFVIPARRPKATPSNAPFTVGQHVRYMRVHDAQHVRVHAARYWFEGENTPRFRHDTYLTFVDHLIVRSCERIGGRWTVGLSFWSGLPFMSGVDPYYVLPVNEDV